MNLRKQFTILFILMAALLALAACRRGRTETVPTVAPTAAAVEAEVAEPTDAPSTPAEPEPTAATVVRPVPVEDIDWPPQVVTGDPLPGQEVAANAPITVRFDQPMDQPSVEAAFAIEPAVAGAMSWPAPDTAVFTPAGALEPGQAYHVRIADSAASMNGQTLQEAVEFAFQATGPLRVTQTIPADGARSVQTDAVVTVVFDKPVVPLVSSGEQAGLPQPLAFDPPIEGAGEWTSTSIYRFTPEPAFAGATTYIVSVNPALTDVTGGLIDAPPTWQFTTVSPEVVTVEPANDAARVTPTTPITVTFNMPMDTAATEAAINLSEAAGATTAGATAVEFDWQDGDRVVVLRPAEPLALETEYTLAVASSATSANGAAAMARVHTSRFTTIPFPAVISTSPIDGGMADVWGNGFSVEFASPMNDATIEDQFVISPAPEKADYFINEWEGSYSVYVQFTLIPNTEYTVTVPATAADPYGNTLGEDYTFTFTSAPTPPLASFNLPFQQAQLSTSFPTDVAIMYRSVSALDVSLYPVEAGSELVFNPYRMNERQPDGEPLFRSTIPTEVVGDEFGVMSVSLAYGGVLPTGIYELRVTAPEVGDDANWWQNRNVMLIVADTNLVVKEMFGEVNIWATNLATGQPTAGLNLTLYRRNGEATGTAVTDADGFARFEYEPLENYLDGVTVISNEPGSDGFGMASTNWTGNVSPWQMGINNDTAAEQDIYAYIYTDRPIYRPGDTVFYKGIVRDTHFGRYTLPDIAQMEITINPGFFMGEESFSDSFDVTLDADGVFHGEYLLPDDLPLGDYTFNITGDFWLSSRSFTVAQYRAPEFTVTVTPEQAELLRGQATQATVNATYLFGGSAAGLPVSWTINQSEFLPTFEAWPAYAFGDTGDFNYVKTTTFMGDSSYLTDGSGETDAAGNAVIPLPADLLADIEEGSRTVKVEATVGGLGEFPVSGRTELTFHAAEVYAGLRAGSYLVNSGDAASVDIVTVDWTGAPVANQPVEVAFYRRDWESERTIGFGMYTTQWTPVDTEVERQTATTDSAGKATVEFTPDSGGTFLAVATVTDDGRQQMSSLSIWSVDAAYFGWRTDPNKRTLDLTPDKTTYRAGETARVLVQSPFAQPVNAWLTIERGTLIEQRVITVTGSEVVEIPISAEFAPNVHVTIAAVKPVNDDPDFPYADIRLGFVELTVPPDQFDLNVTVTPGAAEYAPGDTAAFEVAVTDQSGAPVQAEVSLALVDLAVLMLKEDNAPHILDAFYAPQPLRSNTGSGLLITGEGLPIEEPLPNGGMGGGGGGDVALESARLEGEDDDVRRDFKDTAYWEAKVMTDANGRASVEVPLPDNVTTWRMHSKAATTETEVGQGEADILARLPLIIRPVTPRFFTVGDKLSLGANVNNNTDAAIEATVSLEATGLTIDGDVEQTITVPANGRVLVSWPVTVEDLPAADLTFRVAGGDYRDASKPTMGVGDDALLPIYRYDGRDFVATAGELAVAGRRVEALILPQGVDTRHGEALVRLQPSLAAAIIESFDIVNDPLYPFLECAGSLADRLLHNVSVEAAIRELALDNDALATALAAQNAADVPKLVALQKADGGWGWCFSADSDPWISAQAILALTRAQELGYDVSTIALNNDADYLGRQLQDVDQLGNAGEANRQAFFLYVLSETGEDVAGDADELMAEHRALLDPYAKALLAMAYENAGATGENQAALLADLNDEVIMSATGAHWEDAEPDFLNLSSNIRGTAMVIQALAQLQPDSPLLPPAVRWLMVARTAETWSTLHTTAWSVSALSDWMVASGELEPDFAYDLRVNLVSRASGSFAPTDATASEEVTVPVGELVQDGTNFFDFQRGEGNGVLYYTMRLNSAIAVDQLDPVNRGFTVERRYFDAACDPETTACEPIDSIPAGGRVRVELTVVVGNDRTYVLVEDPIPAGTDAIDPNLLTSESGRGGSIVPAEGEFGHGYWGWWYFDHIQYRDEKVVFLSQYLPAGTYQYSYFLQANIPGTYQVMPATAREDYFPEVFGRSEGMVFTIGE
ncbi:MAG TPA: Ig-like domain-containing protein [Promineifilum sp.]|nr:Ig-like domain-containing protein [Promineifilum sp.]HRQ12989.1 Ig-like domain-containing protein [Promineifilum sp.]